MFLSAATTVSSPVLRAYSRWSHVISKAHPYPKSVSIALIHLIYPSSIFQRFHHPPKLFLRHFGLFFSKMYFLCFHSGVCTCRLKMYIETGEWKASYRPGLEQFFVLLNICLL